MNLLWELLQRTASFRLAPASPDTDRVVEILGEYLPFMTGSMYRTAPLSICVATHDVGIQIGEVLDENGESVILGMKQSARLFTPRVHLDAERSQRVVYGTSGVTPSA